MTAKKWLWSIGIAYLLVLGGDAGVIRIRTTCNTLYYVAARDLAQNHRISADDLRIDQESTLIDMFRPGRRRLVGQYLVKSVKTGEAILPGYLSSQEQTSALIRSDPVALG